MGPGVLTAGFVLLVALVGLPFAGLATETGVADTPGTPPPSEGISLNVKSVDVRDVLATLAFSRSLNIVVAPDVDGKVTVNLKGLGVDETLRAILLVNGLTFVKRDGVIYVTREGAASLDGRAWTETRSFRLAYANPNEAALALKDVLSGNGTVTPYVPTRTLVIQDTPESVDRAASVIAAIDVAPRQVLIGARILEIRLDDDHGFGVDWAALLSGNNKSAELRQYGFANQPTPGTHGFFATITTKNLDAFLDALNEVVDLHALAAPQVLALEGHEAEVIVGGKLGFYITTTTQTSTVQSVEFLDTGSLLTLTPTVSDDGHIVMDIHPKVSDGVIANGLPTETTTEVTTSVLVADGETIFIGGLLRRRDEKSRSGVPVLGSLPLLGSLFGRNGETFTRSEVVVLITPHIVKPDDPEKTTPLQLEDEPEEEGG